MTGVGRRPVGFIRPPGPRPHEDATTVVELVAGAGVARKQDEVTLTGSGSFVVAQVCAELISKRLQLGQRALQDEGSSVGQVDMETVVAVETEIVHDVRDGWVSESDNEWHRCTLLNVFPYLVVGVPKKGSPVARTGEPFSFPLEKPTECL